MRGWVEILFVTSKYNFILLITTSAVQLYVSSTNLGSILIFANCVLHRSRVFSHVSLLLLYFRVGVPGWSSIKIGDCKGSA